MPSVGTVSGRPSNWPRWPSWGRETESLLAMSGFSVGNYLLLVMQGFFYVKEGVKEKVAYITKCKRLNKTYITLINRGYMLAVVQTFAQRV